MIFAVSSTLQDTEAWLAELALSSPMFAIATAFLYVVLQKKLGKNGNSVKTTVDETKVAIEHLEDEVKINRNKVEDLQICTARLDQRLQDYLD